MAQSNKEMKLSKAEAMLINEVRRALKTGKRRPQCLVIQIKPPGILVILDTNPVLHIKTLDV